jgi:O-antigen/teichoic acid export membrane protein
MKHFFSAVSPDVGTASAPTNADPPEPVNLTSGRLLAGNAGWNLLGMCLPALIAVFCLPILKRELGTDRLGIITLGWAILGYFGLFDLGLSRALTKLVAEKLGQKRLSEIPPLVWTSLFLMAALGMIGCAVALGASRWMVERLLRVPPELQRETLSSFYWVGAAIPVVIITAGLRGVLEALQQFRLATAIRVPMGIFTYLGPVLVLPFSHSLMPIMATLVIGRAVAGAAHLWACFRAFPGLRCNYSFHVSSVGPLLRFGSWMTVSNVIGPLMMTFDRFVIGAFISVTDVAYYAAPYEVTTKLLFVPGAIGGVLFPAFSTAGSIDRARLVRLVESGVRYVFIALFPITLFLIAFAPEMLRVWLGTDFMLNSTAVVRWLAVAIFINSLAQIPFAYVQSAGRPDLTAKLHLFELPLYLVLLFVLVTTMGIRGAAIAWLVRASIDFILLFVFSRRLLPESNLTVARLPLMMAVSMLVFWGATVPVEPGIKILFVGSISALSAIAGWLWVLTPRERTAVVSRLRGSREFS